MSKERQCQKLPPDTISKIPDPNEIFSIDNEDGKLGFNGNRVIRDIRAYSLIKTFLTDDSITNIQWDYPENFLSDTSEERLHRLPIRYTKSVKVWGATQQSILWLGFRNFVCKGSTPYIQTIDTESKVVMNIYDSESPLQYVHPEVFTPISCYSMDEMDAIEFEAGSSSNLNELSNEEYTQLLAELRSELYAVSEMKSRQRIAALDLIQPPDQPENKYEVKFLLLPSPTDGKNVPVDILSEEVIQTFNSTINKGQFAIESGGIELRIIAKSMFVSKDGITWVPSDGSVYDPIVENITVYVEQNSIGLLIGTCVLR